MRKKIVILANNDVGLYQFRKELLNELLKMGNEVYISLPPGKLVQPLVDAGCKFINTPIDRRGINPKTDFGLVYNYFKILKKIKPDLVITYTIKPNIYGGFVCRIKKIPYAVNITGLGTAFQNDGILKKFVTFLYTTAVKRAKVIFFENSENMRIFNKLGICQEKDQCKLLNGAGVNLDYYYYSKYPEEDIPVHFLFVGRIMKEKGVDELFEAMEKLHRMGEKCVLDMVGGYEENYSSIIESKQQAGWLNYYGYQEDVRPFIEKCHCFVLPSWHEGMANTNLECASMGRPLITSDIPGCREAVVKDKSGFLCESQNSESLYKKMLKFLSLSQTERKKMGQAGRKHMEDVFDKNVVVAETMKGLGF